MAWIAANQPAAAELYLRATGSKEKLDAVLTQLRDPEIQFTTTPKNIGRYADFMADVGSVKERPASWKDLAFPNLHNLPGS
jgi:NitT/TauT family transport system substrate-binding protein